MILARVLTKGSGKFSGVGLFAVRSIIDKYGGVIRVSSAVQDENKRIRSWQMSNWWDKRVKWSAPGTLFEIELPSARVG
jgi:signal transduction histidine kinase